MAPLYRHAAWAILSLLLLSTVEAADRSKRRLHRFVSHFEPLQYDHGVLMNEHHRVRRTVHGEKEIKLQFTALGRDFDLLLKPDNGEVFHEKMKVTRNGVEFPKSEAKAILYTGVDLNEPGSKAYGNVAFGVFDGFVKTHDDIYVIEPADRFPHVDSNGAHSVIYRHSDMDNSELGKSRTCGAVDRGAQRWLATQQKQTHHSERVRRQNSCTNSRNAQKVRCWLHVIADDTFYQAVATSSDPISRMSQVMGVAATAIRGSSVIYEMTDFDGILSMGPAEPDNIQFGIEFFVVNETVPPSSDFANQFLGVEAYLRSHSNADWESECLSYAFTARDFDNGVLGLAFVASNGRAGGICSKYDGTRTLNTGVVTITNFGQRVPALVTMLTFAHEGGHNFGSEHDPMTAECSPSSGGNYIMFASASSGNAANNRLFSPCSRRMMGGILINAGQDTGCGCFREADDLCGNGIVDDGEECDCRSSEVNGATMLCNNDPCCNGTSCMIATGRECSPQQGPCCNSTTCSFIPQVEDFECRVNSECALNQTCNGTSFACPTSEPRIPENGTNIPCNNDENFCVNGECTGTICIPLNRSDCECTEPRLQCHICCREPNGTCVSTILLTEENPALKQKLPNNIQGAIVRVGFPCSNFTGYCDFFNRCRIINSDGALRRIANAIFSSEIFMTAIQWIMTYWWGVALIGVGILIALFLIVLGCHFLLPRPKHMKRRAEERRRKRDERRRARESGMPQEYPMQRGNFRS